jgi:hypothetical protein
MNVDDKQVISLIRLLEKHADHTIAYVELLLKLIEEMQDSVTSHD